MPRGDAGERRRLKGHRRGALLTAAVVGAIVVGAVIDRLPDLMLVPRLTDETQEVLIGLQIARGQALPLVGVDTYIGAMFSYLLAGAFAVLGPRPETGRLLVLGFGALGVVPTFLLGRSVGGPGGRGQVAGILAALLLAGSATDILVTSRLAYSNSLTPIFTTTGLWLLDRAVRRSSGPSLALSGLAFGLALQTHAAALAVWPGLAVYLLLHRRLLAGRWRWLLAAAGLGVLAVANVLAFNVIHGGATLNEILFRSSDYGGAPSAGLGGWADRLAVLLRAYGLALGGRVSEYVEPSALLTLPVLAYAGLAVGGLVVLARRREWLLPLALLSGLLVISLLNARLEPVMARSRHYAQLLPIGFVTIAVALTALGGWLARRAGPAVAVASIASAAVLLVTLSQVELYAYLADRLDRPEKNNRALIEAVDAVIHDGQLDDRVYLDDQLTSGDTNSNRRGLRDVQFMLTVLGQEYDDVNVAQQPLPVGRSAGASRRVVLSEESVGAAAARYRLVPLPGEPGDGARIRAFRAYSLDAASP